MNEQLTIGYRIVDHKLSTGFTNYELHEERVFKGDDYHLFNDDEFFTYKNPLDAFDLNRSIMGNFITIMHKGLMEHESEPLRNYSRSITPMKIDSLESGIRAGIDMAVNNKNALLLPRDFNLIYSMNYNDSLIKDNTYLVSANQHSKIIDAIGKNSRIISKGNNVIINSSGSCMDIFVSGTSANITSSGFSALIGVIGNDAKVSSTGLYSKILSSGKRVTIISSGDNAVIDCQGEDAVIICTGRKSMVKATKCSRILFAKHDTDRNRHCYISGLISEFVDGITIKPDVWYKVDNEELVEANIL